MTVSKISSNKLSISDRSVVATHPSEIEVLLIAGGGGGGGNSGGARAGGG